MNSSFYVFRNKGVIDPRSITTFGVSSKESKSPIGFFGTGLKYAIAVLLRLKCSVTIHSGGKTYEFSTEKTRIRVNDFDMVRMVVRDPEISGFLPCGFTTELGKTWEVWQAFRELACNALDEGGEWSELSPGGGEFDPPHGETHVIVQGAAFADAWAERHHVLLAQDRQPLFETPDVRCFRGPSQWIYYRGVRVHKLDSPARFTWDILQKQDLTEDRTLKHQYAAGTIVADALKACSLPDVITECVTAKDSFEHGRSFYTYPAPDECFVETVTRLMQTFVSDLSPSAVRLVRDGNLDKFVKDESDKLPGTDRQRLMTAIKFCQKIGYAVTEYPITVSSHLGDGVLGRADGGRIYISTRAFSIGTKCVAGTLIEEYLHLKFKYEDGSREMQNYLLDALVSMAERATKKVL